MARAWGPGPGARAVVKWSNQEQGEKCSVEPDFFHLRDKSDSENCPSYHLWGSCSEQALCFGGGVTTRQPRPGPETRTAKPQEEGRGQAPDRRGGSAAALQGRASSGWTWACRRHRDRAGPGQQDHTRGCHQATPLLQLQSSKPVGSARRRYSCHRPF